MLRAGWFSCLLLLSGCDLLFKITHVDAVTPEVDAPSDAPSQCVGHGILKPCVNPIVDDAVTLKGSIDTDTDPRCVVLPQTDDVDLCALVGVNIMVQSTVAIGSRPLVLIALDSIDIQGAVDVSSRTATGRIGAGAQTKCSTGSGTNGNTGAGGGAGGSYGFIGGNGAAGQGGQSAGGLAGSALQPQTIHGGCPGQPGGVAAAATPAVAGAGGGAFYAIAVGTIQVGSVINASGGGGRGGGVKSGGAGGGAGGLIGLDAETITIAGQVFSRGGGGGGGGGGTSTGAPGADAPVFAGAVYGGIGGASGGTSGGDGADGGVGGIPGGTAVNGGGGGGGACGWIFLWGTATITGALKPPAITL